MLTRNNQYFASTGKFSQSLANRKNSNIYHTDYLSVLNNPDPILRESGLGYRMFDEILSEPFAYGCYDSRINNVLSQEHEYHRNQSEDEAFEVVHYAIENLLDQGLIENILKGRFISPQPIVMKWEMSGSYWLPTTCYSVPPERIIFDNDNKLKLLTSKEPFKGLKVHPHNYLIARDKADYMNPYGVSLLSKAYWIVFIMRNTLKFWSVFTEDFGMPWIDAEYSDKLVNLLKKEDDTISTNDISDVILENVKTMRQNGIFVHPEGAEINMTTSSNYSNIDAFEKLILACKKFISVLILGHEGAAITTPGELGHRQNSMRIREDLRDADSRFIEKYVNRIISWIYIYNFSGNKPIFKIYEKDDIDKYIKKAQLTADLTEKIGMIFSKKYLAREFNIDPQDFEID